MEKEKKISFWHKSMNESESNTKVEDKRYSDLEGEESRTEKEEFLLKQPEKIY